MAAAPLNFSENATHYSATFLVIETVTATPPPFGESASKGVTEGSGGRAAPGSDVSDAFITIHINRVDKDPECIIV